jgi:hypothetical protein
MTKFLDVLAKNLCGCKTKKTGGCCKTTHKLLKIEDSHKFSVNDFSFVSGCEVFYFGVIQK